MDVQTATLRACIEQGRGYAGQECAGQGMELVHADVLDVVLRQMMTLIHRDVLDVPDVVLRQTRTWAITYCSVCTVLLS
jgi:hypothetical protein